MALRPIPDEEAHEEAIGPLLQALYVPVTKPTTDQLLDYTLGISSLADARLIEQQFVTSALIRQELAELQALTGEFVHREAADREALFTTRFLSWLRAQWPALPLLAQPQRNTAAAPVLRGGDSDYQIYTAGPYRFAFTVTKGGTTYPTSGPLPDIKEGSSGTCLAPGEELGREGNGENFLIQGQLLDQEAPDAGCRGNVQLVSVPTNEIDPTHTMPEIMATSALDDFGYFSLSIATPGHYRLVATLPADTIWIQGIQLS